MANASTVGFGAKMVEKLGMNQAVQGQSKYKIKSGLGKNIHKNAPVSLQHTGGDVSYIQDVTHVDDAVDVCYNAWKLDKCRHYSISHQKTYKIIQVAKLFSNNIIYLPSRAGERYASALTKMNLSNKVYRRFGKIDLKNYIKDFLKNI